MALPAAFQVIIPGDQVVSDPLSVWQAVAGGTSFDLQHTSAVVWRADLPSDPLDAANALRFQNYKQRVARQALQAVPQMLKWDLDSSQYAPDDPHFGAQTARPGGAIAVLQQAREHATEQPSFSVLDDLGIIEVAKVFQQFIDQVQRMVGQFALVESAVDGRTSAVTRVAWSGGFSTWSGSHAGALEASQHNQFLFSALSARQDWVRFLTLLTSIVLRISLVLALEPFNPIAIWTAWKYVQEILKEYNRLRSSA